MPDEKVKTVVRKNLEQLFNEPVSVEIKSTMMHQAFQIPGGGTESSLNPGRPGLRDLKLVYHPGYGLIGCLKGRYFLAPSANVIAAIE